MKLIRLACSTVAPLVVAPLVVAPLVVVAAGSIAVVTSSPAAGEEYLNGIRWEAPPVVDPGEDDRSPPSDAVVLFDGTDKSHWVGAENWTIEDGHLIAGKGSIRSVEQFGDCQVHLEWSAPEPGGMTGQNRGNSGLFFLNTYEIQILDSYESPTYHDGQAGAIYKQTPPMANAMRPPGQWNTYDVIWTNPRFDSDGNLTSPAAMTAIHNGVVILNDFELQGDTPYDRPPRYTDVGSRGPLGLQDHNSPVRFRNIWVRELTPAAGERERPAFIRDGDVERPIE